IFNLVTAIIAILFIYQIMAAVDAFSSAVGIAADDYTLKLAVFHTIFNTIGILAMIPFINQLVNFLTRMMPEKEVSIATPKFLSEAAQAIPDTAIESVRKETIHLYDNAFAIIAHSLSLHRHDILSQRDVSDIIADTDKPMSIDIDNEYSRNVKGLYGDIVSFISRAHIQMTSEQGDELFELRSIGRDIVEAIKDTKHLHKNLSAYIVSDNHYIRDEYNKIRTNLVTILRSLEEAKSSGDILSLDNLKLEMKQNDSTANGMLEILIHEDRISAEMATSLMNDASYTNDIIKNLLQMGEVLFATGDLNMKAVERSLALDDVEMQEILDSQQDK
ncbi:MAG: hypothetical protein KAI17_21015, partial [Thiotrichaceae bacterium]|nr:hypothetical protein [Thiotrichaceae bacterium]